MDDPRVEWLIKNHIAPGVATRYACEYTLQELAGHMYRVARSRRVRNFAAVVTYNLQHGRVEHEPPCHHEQRREGGDGHEDA